MESISETPNSVVEHERELAALLEELSQPGDVSLVFEGDDGSAELGEHHLFRQHGAGQGGHQHGEQSAACEGTEARAEHDREEPLHVFESAQRAVPSILGEEPRAGLPSA